MSKLLWEPSNEIISNANITRFMQIVNTKYGYELSSYEDLYNWSIEKVSEFWEEMWQFAEIKSSQKYQSVVQNIEN
ncbi:MAG: acetoacetate--CoA ligase, partial [Candidatus Kariarchaeaceae archaeon]